MNVQTDAASLGSFFRTIMRKYMKVTTDKADAADALLEGGGSPTERRCTFLHLLLTLFAGLNDEALGMLYKVAKPAILEKEGAVQKKAYRVLLQVAPPALCLPHCVSHRVSLTVSPAVSLTVPPTVSPSLCLSLCLPHCASLCASLTVPPTVPPAAVQREAHRRGRAAGRPAPGAGGRHVVLHAVGAPQPAALRGRGDRAHRWGQLHAQPGEAEKWETQ